MFKIIDIPIWAVNRALQRKLPEKPLKIDFRLMRHLQERRPEWIDQIENFICSDQISNPHFIGISHLHPDGFALVYQNLNNASENFQGLASALVLAIHPPLSHHQFYFPATIYPISESDLTARIRKQAYKPAHIASFNLEMTEEKPDLRKMAGALARSWDCKIKP